MCEVVGLQTGSSQMIPTGCFVQPKTASECCTLVQGQLRLPSLRQKSLVKLKDPTAQGHVHMSCSYHVLRWRPTSLKTAFALQQTFVHLLSCCVLTSTSWRLRLWASLTHTIGKDYNVTLHKALPGFINSSKLYKNLATTCQPQSINTNKTTLCHAWGVATDPCT